MEPKLESPGPAAAAVTDVARPSGPRKEATGTAPLQGGKPLSKVEKTAKKLTQGSLLVGVLRFGVPLVLGMILYSTFALVDMFMISRLENATAALGAMLIGDMLSTGTAVLANGIATASVAIVSRRAGQNDRIGVTRTTYQSLIIILVMSVAFGLLGVFGNDFVVRTVLQAKGETADIAASYLTIILGGCFSMFFLLQFTSLLRAVGHAKTAATLLIAGNALNVVLNIFLIYGPGPHPAVFAWAQPIAEALSIPRLGVDGAAWATVAGRTLPAVIGGTLLLRRLGRRPFHPVFLRPRWKELKALVTLGWPSSAQLVIRVGVILFLTSLINSNFTSPSDITAAAAYQICVKLETMVLFVGLGWGAAASSYVGMNIGAGDPKRGQRAGWVAALYSALMMLLLLWGLRQFGEPVIAFFDSTEGVVGIGLEYLGIVGLSYVFLGVGVVLSQAMTGAGATMQSMLIDSVVLLLVVVPAAYTVTEVLGLDRTVLWWAIAGGNVVGATAYVAFYFSGGFLRFRPI